VGSLHEEIAFNIVYGYRCNYSCDGCCVGSNYIKDTTQDPNIDIILESIARLPMVIKMKDSDDYWQRGMITLLGGEPMMSWDDRIVPLAREIRKHFPRTRVNIFSNGHLLNRRTADVIEFIDEISANVTISQHLIGDLTSPMGTKWKDNVTEFLCHPRLYKISDDHYHVKNNTMSNIHFYNGGEWFTWYKKTVSGQIKPHATNNPSKSMQYGCASGSTCSTLFENRLYKCSSLAMLPGLLKYLDQDQDKDWKKYIDYPYIDVLNIDQEKLINFSQTFGKPIDHCDMCSDQRHSAISWSDRKQWMIFKSLKNDER